MLGYNRREELLVARDLVEVTGHGPKSNGYRLVGVWTQREGKKGYFGACIGGQGGQTKILHASREKDWRSGP
jgi:hypothetical protein